MTTTLPLHVAVVVPVYKAEEHLADAVRSALEQPEVVEVVLVEDGSPDGSLALCEQLAATDARVKVLRHPGGINRGAGASRNLGIAACTAPWVAFLDADDYFLPGRFEQERRLLRDHPDADGVYGAIGAVFDDDRARDAFMAQFGRAITTVNERVAPDELLSALMGDRRGFGHFSIDALTVRRDALLPLMPCFPEHLRLHQDTVFLFRLAHSARLYPGSIDAPVAMRRVHGHNRITDKSRESHNRRLMYDELWTWSRGQVLNTADRRRIAARRYYWTLRDRPGKGAAWQMAFRFMLRPWLWRWVTVREELFARLFGDASLITRALRSWSWRLFRDGGSYV